MHRKVRTYIRREPALNYINKFREGACRSTLFFAYMQIKSEKSPKLIDFPYFSYLSYLIVMFLLDYYLTMPKIILQDNYKMIFCLA